MSDLAAEKALELIPFINEPFFKEKCLDVLKQNPTITAFVLNMEIKRLLGSCVRIIDFRKDGNCKEFVYNNIKHFLNLEDIEVFNKQLEIYKGKYTVGLYEAVVNNHTAKKQQRTDNVNVVPNFNIPSRYALDKINFSCYSNRREERMFYCSPIVVQFENGKKIYAKTSDLSCSGIKIILPEVEKYPANEKLTVTFTGLIDQFKSSPDVLTDVPYETIGVDVKDTKAWLKTKCLSTDVRFEEFVLDFQKQNRTRYPIDTDYLAYTLNIRAIEYNFMPKIKGINVFISEDSNNLLSPRFILKSNYNHEELDFWRNENNDDRLRTLLTHELIAKTLSKPEEQRYTYIYVFRHTTQNKTFFFAATKEDLISQKLSTTFFKMSKTHKSFRVYRFEVASITNLDKNLNNIISGISEENLREKIIAELKSLKYIACLTRIDLAEDRDIFNQYDSDLSANTLQQFALNTKDVEPINLEYLQYTKPRSEQRYLHEEPVIIYDSEDNQIATGKTVDISSRGLQVELDEQIDCYNNAVIFVALPKFKNFNKLVPAGKIAYEVAFINSTNTFLHLHVHNIASNVNFVKFIDEFTQNLPLATSVTEMSNLSKALRNLTILNLFSTPILYQKGATNRLAGISVNQKASNINKLLDIYKDGTKKLNVFPFFSNSILKNYILPTLQKAKVSEKQFQLNVYIKRQDNNGEISYYPEAEHSLETIEDKKLFIEDGLKNGYFGAFAIVLTPSVGSISEELVEELTNLKKMAIHKSQPIENNMMTSLGFTDIIDITGSVLLKLGYPNITEPQVPQDTIEVNN